jgi:cytochrome bd ubiquinol oxidase subunit II
MGLDEAPLVLILLGLIAYSILGGADFGAGFWQLLGGTSERARAIREHAHHSMGPVWEANHVWLIFVLVVCWTAYPEAFGSIMSTLAVPLFIAAVGIILRGTAYALRSGAPPDRETEGVTGFVFGVSSILTPFALGTVIGGIAAGEVPVGNAEGDLFSSWLNPTSLVVGVLAVATSGYLAAVYLAGDASRNEEPALARAFHMRALVMALVAGALGVAGLLVLRAEARDLFDDLTSGAGVVAVIASAVGGIATVALVRRERYEPARASAALAVAAIVAGWGLAQEPELLPGLTVDEAAAGDSTLVALLISIGGGLVILVPSLILLYGLVLRGRFDTATAVVAEKPAPRPHRALRPPVVAAGALFAVGAPLTFLTEGVFLAIGVLSMAAFVATGALALLQPEALAGDEP